jgi:DNA-binding NarL/FixJ family response regulator
MKATENMVLIEPKSAGNSDGGPVKGSERRVLRVWVVDDHAALGELFAQLLSNRPGIRCKRHFPSAEALLATLAEERPPDVILLDINLSGKSGLSAIRPIKKLAPLVKVLMFTMFSNSYYEAEALRSGASGFLLKSYEVDEIAALIHEAHRNPEAPGLFPSMRLGKSVERKLGAVATEPPRTANPFSLVGALRELCGARTSRAVG